MSSQIRKLVRRYREGRQKGFTLIELLVVISILGILAAIVTLSLVGITNVATQRAKATELSEVQSAYDTMLADQNVAAGHECDNAPAGAATATNNMNDVKDSNATATPFQGNPWVQAGGNGTDEPVALYPQYLRQETTHGTYWCDGNGRIQQAGYTP